MRTSESTNAIAPAFVAAQASMTAAIKGKTGRIQGKDGRQGYEYSYSDLATVIESVRGPLTAQGIAFSQSAERVDGGVLVVTRLLHQSAEWIEADQFIPCAMTTPQAWGSAITYGKRYGLQALCGLPSDDDDGSRAQADAEASHAIASAKPSEIEISDALTALAGEAESGMQSLQSAMESLRPGLRDHLRAHERAKLATIKTVATRNSEAEHAHAAA